MSSTPTSDDRFDVALDGPGTPLPAVAANRFGNHFDHDFSSVRVHATPGAAHAAENLHAKAFTIESHIFFGAGRYAPESSEGQRLLGHELTHVVQQSRGGGPPLLQCSDLDDVKKVKSFDVESKQAHEEAADENLTKRLAKRRQDLEDLLAKSSKPNRKRELQKDLDKTTDEIVKTPDSKGVYKQLRKDVIKAYRSSKSAQASRKKAEVTWHELDDVFADTDVVKTLLSSGLKPADLKALVAQESGDLTTNPQGKGIAGIAQIGVAEEKRAGGKPGDRKNRRKAIPLAAKVLANAAGDLKKRLKSIPAGIEWKKFLFASYNAGVYAIGTAQDEAIKSGLGGVIWNELVSGGKSSPLFKACQKHYLTKPTPEAKYAEVVKHVKDIFARLA